MEILQPSTKYNGLASLPLLTATEMQYIACVVLKLKVGLLPKLSGYRFYALNSLFEGLCVRKHADREVWSLLSTLLTSDGLFSLNANTLFEIAGQETLNM